ncbi:NUP54 [Mytilus edulis]|uniref:NUP54 n=1 Tax=Mytilus edulis TaxID=6550 RepID=A0A8S3V5H6_MYTED|nr:NUP54 [Mytilus edulis]
MAFFGGAATTPFGTTATTSTSTGFGGFGTQTQSTAKTTAPTFGTGGFGTTTGATAGFGASTGFGLGGTATTQPTAGFGTSTGFGAAPAAGGFGAGNAFKGFGAGPTTGFGATGATGFGAIGGPQLQAQQQQQAQQAQQSNLELLGTAVTLPQIYGDERDAIIAKWNQLQAYWGTGKGFYSSNGFAVGYNRLPRSRNEDGLVSIVIKKKESDVTAQQQQVVDQLFKILGNKPHLSVCVEGIKTLPDDKTELVIYILERPASGPAKRITASELFQFLNTPNIKQQITTQLAAEDIWQKTGFTPEQLKVYLENPPAGIHPFIWEQAKLDNPDQENLIPVPVVGFNALQQRMKHQEQQTKAHQQRLDMIANELQQFQQKQNNMMSKMDEYKRKHIELSHRLLQVVVKQEIFRKMGYAIQADEEQLRVHLEKTQAELNHPTQFKVGRLNELMSQIRMQNHLAGNRADFSYQMDPSLQQEIKQLLKQQQDGLKHLIQIVKDDSHDLQLMEQSLQESSHRR